MTRVLCIDLVTCNLDVRSRGLINSINTLIGKALKLNRVCRYAFNLFVVRLNEGICIDIYQQQQQQHHNI